MNDAGFNGTGSRFNSRFEAGSPIYANQLNDLATGIQSALPQPYVGYGPSVSFTPGGGIIAGQMEDVPLAASTRCPLSIYNLLEEDGAFYINVYPGTVNNLVVKSDDGQLLTKDPPPKIQVFAGGISTTRKDNYIYIRCGNTAQSGGAEAKYPAVSGEGYPSIRVREEADQVDDDDYSYMLIGMVSGIKELVPESEPPAYTDRLWITQLIGCNSLWTERFKCGDTPAVYWWSAV
jgi:hypothetical protein